MDADLSSLFSWNTKQVFLYVTAEWPFNDQQNSADANTNTNTNITSEAVIWDAIVTAPSADWLSNLGPATLKKLRRSAQGNAIDRSRYVVCCVLYSERWLWGRVELLTMGIGIIVVAVVVVDVVGASSS
jgi:hypothetical protein